MKCILWKWSWSPTRAKYKTDLSKLTKSVIITTRNKWDIEIDERNIQQATKTHTGEALGKILKTKRRLKNTEQQAESSDWGEGHLSLVKWIQNSDSKERHKRLKNILASRAVQKNINRVGIDLSLIWNMIYITKKGRHLRWWSRLQVQKRGTV